MKRLTNKTRLISLIAIVAVFAAVVSLGVVFGLDTAPITTTESTTTTPIVTEAESGMLEATASAGPTSATDTNNDFITDAGNVLFRMTSTTAPSGATAISSAATLKSFIEGSATYGYLTADIAVDSSSRANISAGTLSSTQTLDGNGYTITFTGGTSESWGRTSNVSTNLTVTGLSNTADAQGMVMTKNEGTVKNLNIVIKQSMMLDTTSSSRNMVWGAIAAWNTGTIENCSTHFYRGADVRMHCSGRSSDASTNGAYVGGIAGVNAGTIEYCTTTNNAKNWEAEAYHQVLMGGIAGINNGGTIAYCVYQGSGVMHNGNDGVDVTNNSATGGIVAYTNQGTSATTTYGYATISKGTITMCHSDFKGSFKVGGGSKYIGLVVGWFECASATLRGLTAYSPSALSQVGGSSNKKANGTYASSSITWISGEGYSVTNYGGRVYTADCSDYYVYYDYFSQSEDMYIAFDNAAAVSSVTASNATYNSSTKTLSFSSSSTASCYSSGYIGASAITYQGYEANLAYGGVALTDNHGNAMSTSGTQITSATTFPLTGSTSYYLLDDVYIDLSTNYSATSSGEYTGTINGNGHSIYFYGTKSASPTPTTTVSSGSINALGANRYFGLITNIMSAGAAVKNISFVFLPDTNLSIVLTSNAAVCGIVTGAFRGNVSATILNVKVDIQEGASVTMGTSKNESVMSQVGIIAGVIMGGTSSSTAGICKRIWINLDGTFIGAFSTYADIGGICGASAYNLGIVGTDGGYYLFSGSGSMKGTSSASNSNNHWGVFHGGTMADNSDIANGYTVSMIFWDWAWNMGYSGQDVHVAGARYNAGTYDAKKWCTSASFTFINVDVANCNGAITLSNGYYTPKATGIGAASTAASATAGLSTYGTYSIYQALGEESISLNSSSVCGSKTTYDAEKYTDLNIGYTNLNTGYGTASTYVRYSQAGYTYSSNTLKLNVVMVNKGDYAIGYEYDGTAKGKNTSDYLVVATAYNNAPSSRQSKAKQAAYICIPASVSSSGTNVGSYTISSYTIPSITGVVSNTGIASVVVYPKTVGNTITANSVRKGYDSTSTATFTVGGVSISGAYSTSASAFVETTLSGTNLAVWTSAYTDYTSLPSHIVNGSVVSEGYYVVTGASNYCYGKKSACVISSGKILYDADAGEIYISTIDGYTATVTMSDGSVYNDFASGGYIIMTYSGNQYTVNSVIIPMLGNVSLDIAYGSGDQTNINTSGIQVTCTSTTYQGSFSFKYYIVPKLVTINNVHAVYGGTETYTVDPSKTATDLMNDNRADSVGDYAVADISGLVTGDTLGKFDVHYGYETDSADYSNANATIDGTLMSGYSAYKICVYTYFMTLALQDASGNYSSYSYLIILVDDGTGQMVQSNYAVGGSPLQAPYSNGYVDLANNNVGYIRQRVVSAMSTSTPLYFRANVEDSVGGTLSTQTIAGTAGATSSTSTPFETVYSREDVASSDLLYIDQELTTPVTSSAISATEVGFYSVSVTSATTGNYYADSSSPLTVWFRIVPYQVLLTGTTEVVYGSDSITEDTVYTYTAYGTTLNTVWSGSPSFAAGGITYASTYTVPQSPYLQDVVCGYYSQDGNYYVPNSTGGHSLYVTKATVYVTPNENTAAYGNIANLQAPHTLYYYQEYFKNGQTLDTVAITADGTLAYAYDSSISDNSIAGVYTNAIYVANPDILIADNYVFVQHPTEWGTLYIKQEVTAETVLGLNFVYTATVKPLTEGVHYVLTGVTEEQLPRDQIVTVAMRKNEQTGAYEETEFRDAGEYMIRFDITNEETAKAFMITSISLSIAKASATVTANAHTAEYGDVPTTDSGYVITNLVGDDANQATTYLGNLTYTYTYTAGAKVTDTGISYTLTPVVPTHVNYVFVPASGVLTIVPRVVEADWYLDAGYTTKYTESGVEYNGSSYRLYPRISNLYPGDNIVLSATGNYTAVNAGSYTANLMIAIADSDASDYGNYTASGALGLDWTINRKVIDVTAQNIVMGTQIFYSGLPNTTFEVTDFSVTGEDAVHVSIAAVSDTTYLNAGLYTVVLTLNALSNYTFIDGLTKDVTYAEARVYKKVLTIVDSDIKAVSKTYTGNDIAYLVSDFSVPLYASYTEVKSVGAETYVDAGSYYHTVTLVVTDNNYCIDAEDIAEKTYQSVPVVIAPQVLTYTASDISTPQKDWQEGGVTFGTGDFSAPQNTSVTDSANTSYLKAGSYPHSVTLTTTSTNFVFAGNVATKTLEVTVEVLKASLNYDSSSVTQTTVEYWTGSTVVFTAKHFSAPQYTSIASLSVDQGQELVNAGDKSVTVVLLADDNHCFVNQDVSTITLTGVKATISKAVLNYGQQDVRQETVEYNGSEITFVPEQFSADYVTIDLVEKISGQDYVNVGTPSVKLTMTADANHCFAGGAGSYVLTYLATISKLQVDLSVLTGYTPLTQVYNGGLLFSGTISLGTHYTASASDGQEGDYYVSILDSTLDNKNVGERSLTVTFRLNYPNNYDFRGDVDYIVLPIIITPAIININNIDAVDREYDGGVLVDLTRTSTPSVEDGVVAGETVTVNLGQGVVGEASVGTYDVSINTVDVLSVWLTGTYASNYTVAVNDVDVVITAKTVTSVTWSVAEDTQFTYGYALNPAVTANFVDVYGDVSTSVRVTYTKAGEEAEFVNAGTYVATAVSTDANYVINASTITLTMSRKMLNYTADDVKDVPNMTYTGADMVFDGSGFTPLAGISSYTVIKKADEDYVNAGEVYVVLRLTVDDNHVFLGDAEPLEKDVEVKIVINKATPIISTLPTASSIVYLEQLSKSTLSGGQATLNGINVAGTYSWADGSVIATSAGNKTFEVVFAPSAEVYSNGKTYQDNFTTATVAVTVYVDKATPTILNKPQASSIYYGDTVGSSVLSKGTASTAGEYAWVTPDVVPTVNADGTPHQFDVVFTPTGVDSSNYYSVTISVDLYVLAPQAKLNLVLTAITYGDQLSKITLEGSTANYNGTTLSGTFSWQNGDVYPKVSDSGLTKYVVVWTPTDSNNYSTTTLETTIEVGKFSLSMTSDTQVELSKEYDGTTTAQVIEVGTSNKLASDSSTILAAVANYDDVNVAEGKRITISYVLTGIAADNYVVPADVVVDGGSISPRIAQVTWQNTLTFSYDKTEHVVTATVQNAVLGDVFGLTYTDNSATDAGKYTAVLTALGNGNYKLADGVVESVDWTVAEKGVELVWSNTELVYNGTEQSVTATVKESDVIDGDTVTVTGYLDGSNMATDAATYTATAIALSNQNYKIAIYDSCTYTIKPMQIVVTDVEVSTTKTYDGTFSATVTSSGTNNIIATDGVSMTVTATYKKNTVGEHKIDVTYILTGDKAGNYLVPQTTQYDGRIDPLPVVLEWTATDLTYTGQEQAVTAKVTNAITVGGIKDTVNVAYENNSNKATNAGQYTAVAVLTNLNYTLEGCANRKQDYIINKAVLTDNTQDVEVFYTATNVSITLALSGFKGSDGIGTATIYYGTSAMDVTSTTPIVATTVSDSTTVYYKATFQNYQDVEGSKTITIKKAVVTATATQNVLTKTYDGTTAVIGGSSAITTAYYTVQSTGATPQLTIVNTPSYDYPTVKDATSVRVQFALGDSDNFEFGNNGDVIDVKGSIVKAIVKPTPKQDADTITKVYDETTTVKESILQDVHYVIEYTSAITTTVTVDTAKTAYTSPQASQNTNVKVTFVLGDADNFAFETVNGVLQDNIYLKGTIEKAVVTVTAKSGYAPLTKVYDGTTDYTASLTGYYEVSSTGATPKAIYVKSAKYNSQNVADASSVTAVFANNDTNNYVFTEGGDVVTFSAGISRRTATVTVIAPSITYGSLASFRYTLVGALDGDDVVRSYAYDCDYDLDTNRDVASYPVVMTITDCDPNYTVNVAVGSQGNPAYLTVTKAPLTVKADDVNINYGEPLPSTFSATVVGIISRDTLDMLGEISYACDYVQGDGVGKYAITPSGLTTGNYEVTYEVGYVIIEQTVVTVVANDVSITYGDAPSNDGVKFLLNGVETAIEDVSGTINYVYNYKRYDSVGSYTITPDVSNISSGNYAFEGQKGVLTVNKRTVKVQAGNVTQVYGNTQVNLSLSKYYSIVEGSLVNNDRLYGSMVVEAFDGVAVPEKGTYVIARGTLGDSNVNYTVDFVEGVYTIEARAISITLYDQYLSQAGDEIDQNAYSIRSGEVVAGDNLNIVLVANIEEGASQGTITATYNNKNYDVTFKTAFIKYGKEDSKIVYNNAYATDIDISIPYDGKAHFIDVSCTSGEPVVINYGGYEIVNSFTEVNVYELILTARETNTHHAPTPVNVRLRIYYENLTTDKGVNATVSSSNGFEKFDTFAVTEQDKNTVDLSSYVGDNQTIVEQYAITLKDGNNNPVVLKDGKIVLDVPSTQLIDNGKVTVLVCEKGVYRLVTASVITLDDDQSTQKVVIDINEGIEQIAFVQNSSSFDILYVGTGVLIALAGFGAIIALIVVFFVCARGRFSRWK